MTFTAIFIYIPPEALFNTTKTGFQMKGLVVRNNLVLFEVNRKFHSKVMIILITTKFLKMYLPFGQNLLKVTFRDKITGIFLAYIEDHNFGMKTLINFK